MGRGREEGVRQGRVGASGPEDADYMVKLQLSGFLCSTIQLNKVQTLQKVSNRKAFSSELPARTSEDQQGPLGPADDFFSRGN